MTDLYISVGIDVGADFSFMSIALPNQTFVGKPFKITHSNLDSVETAVKKIKEAEEEEEPVVEPGGETEESDKTGEGRVLTYVAILALASLMGMAVTRKQEEQ